MIAKIKANIYLKDKNILLDFVKCNTQGQTILYACKKNKKEATAEKELTDKLNNLKQDITINGETNLTEYLKYKNEWENFLNKRYFGLVT